MTQRLEGVIGVTDPLPFGLLVVPRLECSPPLHDTTARAEQAEEARLRDPISMKTVEGIGNIVERGGVSEDSTSRFVVPVELCELDSFSAPERAWTATTVSLNRTHLVISSRRMTFIGREILASIKLASGAVAKLHGTVASCEYHARSMHRIVIALVKTGSGSDPGCAPVQHDEG